MPTGRAPTPDGARLAFQVVGPDDAPPLLLLQGQANSHRWWDPLRAAFATGFRTVTFDWRGTGATATPYADPWTTSSFAADAVAVLDALGIGQAHVYATSMGGRVAQRLAIEHPARVAHLVLACTSPGGRLAHERGLDVRRALDSPDPAVRRATLLDLMYTPGYAGRERSTLLGDPTMTMDATRRHLRVSAKHDASGRLGEITAPTLVLHGDEDRMVPTENASLIAERIPGARTEITPGGRHGFFDEFADAVTPRVIGFLRG